MTDSKIVILGAGMAGLGAAYYLRRQDQSAVIYDAKIHAGGHTASWVNDDGFIFDEGPHISFTKSKRIQQLFSDNVDGEYETLDSYVDNYYYGHWIKHPAQANLHNLPTELKASCLLDFIAADKNEIVSEPANYLEWLKSVFGDTFAVKFPAVYAKKYHTLPADQMSTVWIGPRIYRPSMEEVVRGALFEQTDDVHYIPHFRYPKTGGFYSFLKPFVEASDVRVSHRVIRIDPQAKQITFENGTRVDYTELVSSIPLPDLVSVIDGVPDTVRAAAASLACTTCVTVNVGLTRNDFTGATWSYFYDEDITFTRLSFPHRMSPGTCPPGHGSIQAECYYSTKYRPLNVAPEDLVAPVIADLKRVGLMREDEPIVHTSVRLIPYANIIFDLDRETALPIVQDWLAKIGIHCAGRYGIWGYHWTDESFISGEEAAAAALAHLSDPVT
ncbi:MAG: FAD-dependent oxidoreductase [Jannaschia sp.]